LLAACGPVLDAQTMPDAPTDLLATAMSANLMSLSWACTCTDEDGFKIEQATSGSGPWMQVAQISLSAVDFQGAAFPRAGIHYYRIRAYDSTGDSGFSNLASMPAL
jgi:hypothetical protein